MAQRLALDQAIRQRTNGEFDAPLKRVGSGWLYDLNGEIFYSPNCYRRYLVKPADVSGVRDGIVKGREFNIEVFRRPQWYTKAHGYFGFMPLIPDVRQPPLDPLTRIPFPIYDQNTNTNIPTPIIYGSWKTLQHNIVQSCNILLHDSGAPNVRTAYPCARVDNLRKPTKGVLKNEIFKAGHWFEVWMGCLSYAIAVSKTIHKTPSTAITSGHAVLPYWMDLLLQPLKQRQEELRKKREAEEYLQRAAIHHPGKDTDHLDPNSFLNTPPEAVVDGAFVSNLANSHIATFDDPNMRVGLFVKIPDINQASDTISIDWLCEMEIPVFYAWGDREKARARDDVFWQRYAPPADAVFVPWPWEKDCAIEDEYDDEEDDVGNFSEKPSSRSLQQAAFRRREPRRLVPENRVWEKRIHEQEVAGAELLLGMEEAEKETVSSRTTQPPTSQNATHFFVWEKLEENGDYVRCIARASDLDYLFEPEGKFGRKQAHYNAVFNEWDLCDFLGVPDDDQIRFRAKTDADAFGIPEKEALAYWTTYYGVDVLDITMEDPDLSNEIQLVEKEAAAEVRHSGEGTEHEEGEIAEAPLIQAHDVTRFARERLGFTIPPGETIYHAAEIRQEQVKLGTTPRMMGLSTSLTNYLWGAGFWKSSTGRALIAFTDALAKERYPSAKTWDLSRDNHMPVVGAALFKKLQRCEVPTRIQEEVWDNVKGKQIQWKQDKGIYYWLNMAHRHQWYLGSLSAAVALVICRQPSSSDPWTIAWSFAERGIPFQTWFEVKYTQVDLVTRFSQNSRLLQYRHNEHRFTKRDYEDYETSLRLLLDGPAARGAIRAGGIVWKIARVAGVSIYDTLQGGPSRDVMAGHRLIRSDGHGYFVDDLLNGDEMDAICGTYELSFGKDQYQRGRASWYPPADVWAEAFGSMGWTHAAEAEYAKRRAEILGGAPPLGRNAWRKRLNQSGGWRRSLSNLEKWSDELYKNQHNGGL